MGGAAVRRRRGAVPFRYFQPAKRRATQYEEVTLHAQWHPGNYAAQGWFNRDREGRGTWDEASTALRASDWWAYRDPGQDWFRPFAHRQAALGDAIEQAIEGARRARLFDGFSPGWKRLLQAHYAAYRFPEYGLFLCFCHAQREALSDVVASPIVLHSLEKDRHAQDIALYCMELEGEIDGFSDADCRGLWMESPLWQPTRRWIELLLAARDWGEILCAAHLVYEPLVATLFTRELLLRAAPHHGDPVTPILAGGAERDRELRAASTGALVRFLIEQEPENGDVINAWIEHWSPGAIEACRALAPVFELPERGPQPFAEALRRVLADWGSTLRELGLRVPAEARS